MPRDKKDARKRLVMAAIELFAEKGFDGTTTRELADAAGVSEALLFKHFPNKSALFIAVRLSCGTEQESARFAQLRALEPSASTLVLMVHFLVSRLVGGCGSREDEQVIQNRLMLRSLAEDGEFARLLLRRIGSSWIPKIEEFINGDKNAIVIVGAAHLVGKEGVVQLLKNKGYRIMQE